VARGHRHGSGVAHRPPPKGVAANWLAPLSFFLFFFLKSNHYNYNIFSIIYLYLFIKSDTCPHFISADATPNRICQIFSGNLTEMINLYFGIP
jgi:hypothetical protein